MYNKELV